MPAIWASSERPLFVRTVWVDGMRHAILSPDDPVVNSRLRRRSQTSKEKNFSVMHQQTETRLDRLNSCFMNLHVVVEKNFPDGKVPPRIVRRQSAPPCTKMCTKKNRDLLEIYMSDKLDEDCENYQGKEEEITFNYNNNVEQPLCLQRDTFINMTECKQSDETSDCNPLSERVLQWLDLSGRAQDYELETESEKSSKLGHDRRSNVISRRKHFPRRRENSVFAEKERIVVQNYKLQQDCKLERVTKNASETKLARKRLSKMKDTRQNEKVKEETIARVLSDVLKDCVPNVEENSLQNEDEPRDDLVTVWSPPGRLQLHIVMPNFNSVEKRASSPESLACD